MLQSEKKSSITVWIVTGLALVTAAAVFFVKADRGSSKDAFGLSIDQASKQSAGSSAAPDMESKTASTTAVVATADSGKQVPSGMPSQKNIQPFYPQEVAKAIKKFLADFQSKDGLTAEQQEEFMERLHASIESSSEARDQVKEALRSIPPGEAMEKDLVRQMLVTSEVGRDILKSDAMGTWESKDKALYSDMYETLFMLSPGGGVFNRDLFENARTQLTTSKDLREQVALLNYVGVIEKLDSPEANAVRQSTIDTLNQLANSAQDETVRALAVQKLYRLSASPEQAAQVATRYLSQSPYQGLIDETNNSISSGDVKLTAELQAALNAANNKVKGRKASSPG